jgi:hypothetical protein
MVCPGNERSLIALEITPWGRGDKSALSVVERNLFRLAIPKSPLPPLKGGNLQRVICKFRGMTYGIKRKAGYAFVMMQSIVTCLLEAYISAFAPLCSLEVLVPGNLLMYLFHFWNDATPTVVRDQQSWNHPKTSPAE